jgi:hypothetical protein
MHRQQRWLEDTGLNLIRRVIRAYFIATALGLISGLALSALFLSFIHPQTARSPKQG